MEATEVAEPQKKELTPREQSKLPYDKQIVGVEVNKGYLHYERSKRADVVREHLQEIDPSLENWADKFGPEPQQIKDISHPEYFWEETAVEALDELKPEDLILVHLTDTFPEDGIIRPMNHYRPEYLRNSIHFTLNGPVVEEQQYGVGQWSKRKYIILVPLDKAMDKIENFEMEDTFTLGDFELPEGSVVVSNNAANFPEDKSKSGKAKLAIENFGQTPWDLRKAAFRSILSQGYTPMRQVTYGWLNWTNYPGHQIIEDFAKKHGVNSTGQHVYHWAHDLESESYRLLLAKEHSDPQKLQRAIWDSEHFIQNRDDVPEKYKQKLKDLVESYKKDLPSAIESN